MALVCILGAGAAGITIALELIDSGLSVLSVESGGLEYDQATQELYKAENASFKQFPLESTRLRFFGGTTNHWAGMCRPLDAYDFEREYDGISSWPISKQDLHSYYQKAQNLCELGENVYDNYQEKTGVEDGFLKEIKGDKLRASFFQRSPPTRFGGEYLERLKKAKNIQILLNANVKELVENPQGTHITSALVATLSDVEATIVAKKFILATVGLENPRLLLLSNRKNKAGIGNSHDLVGRYYMDHIGRYTGKVIFREPIDLNSVFFEEKKISDFQIGAFLAPTEELIRRRGCGNFRLQLTPGSEADLSIEILRGIKQDVSNLNWPDDLILKLSDMVSNADVIANLAYKNIFDTTDKVFETSHKVSDNLLSVFINMEQTPNYDSRVTLGDNLDGLGLPMLNFDWRLSIKEEETLNIAMQEFASMLGLSGGGRFRTSSELTNGESDFGISCHHSGTTRMANDPRHGVVDRNCRVHGTSNLYLAGSSVFSTIGWANPTLTIVALSLRLADRIKSTFTQDEYETASV
jgi:choline dehydrogenase-like flavoprotein